MADDKKPSQWRRIFEGFVKLGALMGAISFVWNVVVYHNDHTDFVTATFDGIQFNVDSGCADFRLTAVNSGNRPLYIDEVSACYYENGDKAKKTVMPVEGGVFAHAFHNPSAPVLLQSGETTAFTISQIGPKDADGIEHGNNIVVFVIKTTRGDECDLPTQINIDELKRKITGSIEVKPEHDKRMAQIREPNMFLDGEPEVFVKDSTTHIRASTSSSRQIRFGKATFVVRKVAPRIKRGQLIGAPTDVINLQFGVEGKVANQDAYVIKAIEQTAKAGRDESIVLVMSLEDPARVGEELLGDLELEYGESSDPKQFVVRNVTVLPIAKLP